MGAVSQELNERAKLLISERKYQDAVRACRRALLSQPDQVEVRLLLGEALLALERYDEVRVEMMALARKLPHRGDVHRLLGEAYLRDRRPTQAIESLRRALELDPNDVAARELLMEADDETAPISSTIERWFAEDATPTLETESPPWEEEKTPVPATGAQFNGPPSVEIDPSLTGQAPIPAQQTKVQGPRVRSRQPTLAGQASAFGAPPPNQAAFVPPPSARIAPPSAPPPMPASSVPPPPRMPVGPFPADPNAAFGAPPSGTDELELDSLDAQPLSDEFEPLDEVPDELSGAPTNAHASMDDALMGRPMAHASMGEVPDELSGASTRAHVPAPDFDDEPETGVRPPNPFAAPPSPHVPAPMSNGFAPAPAGHVAPKPRVDAGSGTTRMPLRQLKRWAIPAAIGGGVLLMLFIGLVVGVSFWLDASARDDILEAARTAGDSGLRRDLDAALAQLHEEEPDEPELLALEARLMATLVLEHGEDRAAAEVALSRVAAEPGADARIAAALLDLDGGDAASALQRLSGLVAEGEQVSEAFRARALATAALGRVQEAVDSASRAAALRPASPRHASLHALMQHRAGKSADALALLDALPGADSAPSVHIARARIVRKSDPTRAHAEASAVIGQLGEVASPPELAWAHLILASNAVDQGDAATALTEARAAAEHMPPIDHAFGNLLVETFLRADGAADARTQLARLPDPPIDASARALLSAEVALANGDVDAAEAALGSAEEGPRRSLLRGRVLEARGEADAARALYEEAMRAPGPEGTRARKRLASLALEDDEASRAIELLEPARASAAGDLELTSLLTRAYIAEERWDDAQGVLDAALAREPDSAELLAARGALELRRGRFTEALATLRRAVEARPEDPALQVDLGDAARLAGELDAARAAFEAALALRADHPGAQLGLARLALAAGDLEQAEQRLESAGADTLEAARVRGELLVQRGDGALGVEVLEPLARRHHDSEIWTSLGLLQAQAEEDRDASRSFRRAVRGRRTSPDAQLGASLLDIRRGDLRGARRAIDEASERGESLGAPFQARVQVARARLEFEHGDFDAAVRLANEALELDAENGSAHLVLANVAIERGDSPIEHLRRAVAGHAPPPEALGRLASRLERGEEACRLATRYMQIAPDGYDAPDVRDVARRCD